MIPVTDLVRDAVASQLADSYDCIRVWSAWSYGTMGEDDFLNIGYDSDRVEEISESTINSLPEVYHTAPELLKALEFMVEVFGKNTDGYLFSKRYALSEARKIIAQAKGEQND